VRTGHGQRRVGAGLPIGEGARVDEAMTVPGAATRTRRFGLLVAAVCVASFALGGGVVGALRPETAAHSQVSTLLKSSHTVTAAQRQHEISNLLAERYYRPVDTALLAGTPVARLRAVLDDPYTEYLNPAALKIFNRDDAGLYAGIGLEARLVGGDVVLSRVTAGSPAAAADLRAGDVLVSADDVPLRGLTLDAALRRVSGPIGTTVRLQVRGSDQSRTVVVRRAEVVAQMVTHEVRMVAGQVVGYVQVLDFSQGVGEATRVAMKDLKARGVAEVVLDLRSNGGGLVAEAVDLAGVFIPAGTPVLIESGEHIETTTYRTETAPADDEVPLAVLVDKETASAAEIVTGALRDAGRATVVGEKTFGKGVVQDLVPLTGGGALKYTMAQYLTPAGVRVDHRGIVPDVAVATPKAGGKADPVFDTAVRTLKTLRTHDESHVETQHTSSHQG
jgi:carboxyl-terminal processing protease